MQLTLQLIHALLAYTAVYLPHSSHTRILAIQAIMSLLPPRLATKLCHILTPNNTTIQHYLPLTFPFYFLFIQTIFFLLPTI